ncbi:MAG: ABC transporter substrate-binding protein [Halobacteriales archaeon]|nr:ABC transporter substrate-binding protein [Halobacteriales archaeon]
METNAVSLLPSATEMLYAVGVEPVGVSHECDYPPEAREKPSVTTTRVTGEGTSAEINESVAEAVEEGGVYEVDMETLEELEPDVIVTQAVCDVCAVGDDTVREAVESIDASPCVVSLHSHTLDGVLDDVLTVGEAVERDQAAREAVENLRERLETLRERTANLRDERTVVLDWLDPPMVAVHWVPELVDVAGGTYPLAETGDASTPREWDEIVSVEPETLVAAPCGFELGQTVRNFDEIAEREGWRGLPAVERGRAYAADGHNYFNRPGPRLVDTAEILACALHPEEFGAPPSDAMATPVRVR